MQYPSVFSLSLWVEIFKTVSEVSLETFVSHISTVMWTMISRTAGSWPALKVDTGEERAPDGVRVNRH